MKIKKKESKYHTHLFTFDYNKEVINFCRKLKGQFGYRNFNYTTKPEKGWAFSDKKIIEAIKEKYPNVEVEGENALETKLQNPFKKKKKSKLVSNKDLNLKKPLYDFQLEGLNFIIENNGVCMLADEMGLGKTITAIAYTSYIDSKTLIIAPSFLKLMWQDEIEKFTDKTSTIIEAKDLNKPEKIDFDVDYIIINYACIKKAFKKDIDFTQFDTVVCDESSYIKSAKSQRSKYTRKLKFIQHRLLLTGTPILNRPDELWAQLNMLDPNKFRRRWNFFKKYCNLHKNRFGWDHSGRSNIDELREKISELIIRRKKEDVLTELPPKSEQTIRINLPRQDRTEYLTKLSLLKQVINKGKGEQLSTLTKMKQLTSHAKLPKAKKLIKEFIDNGEKIVLFSQYLTPLYKLKKHFENQSVVYEGDMSNKEKQRVVKKFQDNDNVKVFLGSIKACSMGITLHSASNCIFLDLPWTPALVNQASDRLHRIGQEDSVSIYYLVANDTVDEDILATIKEKMDVISQIMGEEKILKLEKQNVLSDVVKRLQKQYIENYE